MLIAALKALRNKKQNFPAIQKRQLRRSREARFAKGLRREELGRGLQNV
jgi:hypothetical protein